MITLYIINSLLIGAVALVALGIMIYWHRATAGGWRCYPSGKSVMGLLAIIFLITANAAIQTLVAPYVPMPVRAGFYFGLYLLFIAALLHIGFTIRKEIRRGRAQDAHPSTTKESSHD